DETAEARPPAERPLAMPPSYIVEQHVGAPRPRGDPPDDERKQQMPVVGAQPADQGRRLFGDDAGDGEGDVLAEVPEGLFHYTATVDAGQLASMCARSALYSCAATGPGRPLPTG